MPTFTQSQLLGLAHKVDLYSYEQVQDESGAVSRDWAFSERRDCMIRTYAGKSGTSHPQEYNFQQKVTLLDAIVRVRTIVPIGTEYRLANMRDASGNAFFPEPEDTSGIDGVDGTTIFVPHNSTPIIDHTGNIIIYETLCTRAEIQHLDGLS